MKNNKMYLMDVAQEGGAAGGGNGTTLTTTPPVIAGNANAAGSGANAGANIDANGANSNKFNLPENWLASLEDAALREDPTLKSVKDINSFAKMLVHAQKSVGADKVVIPSAKHATDADWKEFYKKVGVVPDTIEKYEPKIPDMFANDKEVMADLKKVAFENNVSQKQFEKLTEAYGEKLKGIITNNQTLAKQQREVLINGLKVEWGKAFDQNVAAAKAAVDKTGDESLKKLLDSTGLGDHPAIIKAFAKMGAALGEDQIIRGGTGSGERVYTPTEARMKRNEIMGNSKHPYYDAAHPNHVQAVKEVQELFSMEHPT